MNRVVKRLAFAAIATFAASGAIAAPVVTNGNFEDGLTGWTVGGSGTTPGIGITVITTGGTNSTGYGDNVPAYDGTHAVFFVDDNANETLSQSITIGHGLYDFSFALFATQSGAANPFGFSLNYGGSSLFQYTKTDAIVPVGVWTTYHYSLGGFVPGTYTLSFNFTSGALPAKDVLLDAIAITAIPEPSSWALMMLGVAGIGFAMRRRKVAVQFA